MSSLRAGNDMKTTSYRMALVAGFVTIYVIWGSTYLGIARAVATIPPLLMMGIRSVVAGAILYGFARTRGAAPPERVHWRSALLTGGLFFLLSHGLLAWAQQSVPSGQAALLGATSPLWVILLGWLLWRGERPLGSAIAGVLLGMAGVGVLVGPASGQPIDLAGSAAVLGSAGTWALGLLLARRVALPESLSLATGIQLLAGGTLLLLASAFTGELAGFDVAAVRVSSLLGLGYLIVFGSVLAFSAYVWLLRVSSPVGVSTHAFVNPLVAVVLGWGFNGESLSPRMAVASVLIVASVVLVVLSRRPRRPRLLLRRGARRTMGARPAVVPVSAAIRGVLRDRAGS